MPADPAIEGLMAKAEAASALCQACANPRRLLILCHLLQKGRLNVGELGLLIPEISQSALSQHLQVLKAEGLVSALKESQLAYYSIADPAVGKLLALLQELYC